MYGQTKDTDLEDELEVLRSQVVAVSETNEHEGIQESIAFIQLLELCLSSQFLVMHSGPC